MKRIYATLVALAMILSLAPAAFGAWYDAAADYVSASGLLENSDLNDSVTAREVADALWQQVGRPGGSAAEWAAAHGIPADNAADAATREELAVLLWRASGSPVAGAADFADVSEISADAVTAVAWAKESGAMSGVGGERFSPKDGVTRAMLAQVLLNRSKVRSADELAFPLGMEINSDAFTGAVYFSSMVRTDDTYHFPATNNIIFSPGARSSWHTHGGMVILVTGGVGYYQEEGKSAQIIRKGDIVEIPAGVRHWHGAAPDSWFSQMVIYDSADTGDGTEEPVSDAWYNALEAVEWENRGESSRFLFPTAAQTVSLPTFSGPAYVSSLLSADNAAGAPELHYVAFGEGVINNWHIHEGGQILVATDGVGYHQIEGEPVEVLYPGDVAFCPPGVKHWHGGSADTEFAHIAVNTNPEKTGLEWFDRISEEDYAKLPKTKTDTTVTVTGCQLSGAVENGIYQYLGVPYGEAKELFVPAEPVTPWEGVREATAYGSISYQSGMFGQAAQTAGENESNNAQNLNIWTPGLDDAKRPVMVWLHGGGFSAGSANEAQVDGENLSRLGDVVVVGVNHRLGVYGHLALSSYGEKYRYSANVGMMDVVDALKWLKENAEAFGGDPNNITLFGESGGGAKVLTMMCSPYAKGLFRRGIVESGATEGMGVSFAEKEVSVDLGRTIVEKLGVTQIEDIQKVSYGDLQAAATEAQNEIAEKYKIPVSIGTGYAFEWEPVVEGDFLPQHPVQETGFADAARDYPLLIGSNLNEWNLFMADLLRHTDLTDETKAAFAEAYPNEKASELENLDTLLRLPLLKITAHKADQNGAPVYSYLFTKQAGAAGSYHGAEIPYVFHNTDDKALADTVAGLWASFARDGVPALPGVDAWEPYTRESGAVMILDDETYLAHHHDEKLLSLLAPDYQW